MINAPDLAVIYFAVTNDLTYDQRMIRICSSLADAGYDVTLVGRRLPGSLTLRSYSFKQKRLACFFNKGKLFYAEFNARLFLYLLFRKMSGVCAIDLDTILPCYYISKWKRVNRIYDAHELFCEMKEVVSRPAIYKAWKRIEKKTVPHFQHGYTVNEQIADEFRELYGVRYEVIRNVPRYEDFPSREPSHYLLYQGAVNEGRAFETLIPAMKNVDMPLWIVGDGNFMGQLKELIRHHGLEDKVICKGKIDPVALKDFTRNAFAGVTLFDLEGQSNYLSLANRFFDYMHAGIPQVCVNYPEYAKLNAKMPFALLINDVEEQTIASALNELIRNRQLWKELQQNAKEMAKVLNWQNEQLKLLSFYRKIFG